MLPFYHSGMSDVMPKRSRIPRVGKTVTVVVGEPVDMRDLALRCGRSEEDQTCVWRDVAERIEEVLRELEKKAPPNRDQVVGREAEERQRRLEGAMPLGTDGNGGGGV